MIYKRARLRIEAADSFTNYSNHDFLLRGPKKASIQKHVIGKNLIKSDNSINLIAELEKKNPEEWVIFRARAIDAGGSEETGETFWGPNDNGDFFSEEELLKVAEGTSGKKSFETFIGVPVFVNHENTNVEKARGKIVNAFYDMDNHCVWVDGMIDGKAYPELARAVREGYVNDVSMGSLHSDSKVLMSDGGLKKHSELSIGDLVLTHTGQIQPITMICRSNEPIECYEIDFVGEETSIKCSYDHPILSIKKEECDCIFDYNKKAKCTPLGIEKNISCKRKKNCTYSSKKEKKEYNPSFIKAKELKVGDYLLTPIDKWEKLEDSNASLEFSRILGYYLSEGYLKPTTEITFTFNIKENNLQEDLLRNIKSFCDRQGYNYRVDKKDFPSKNSSEIHVFCKNLYHLIGEFSDGTAIKHNKRIKNNSVFSWSKELKLELLGKMIEGDGCNVKTKKGNGNSLKFYSNSEPLASQFNDISLSCGIISRKSSILRDEYSEKSIVKSKPNTEYSVSIGNQDADKFIGIVDKVKKKEKTRTMLSNERFIWNGYLCSPVKNIKKSINEKDFYYHIEVGGNEDKEIDKKSDHTYISDNVVVHNCSVKYSKCSYCGHNAETEKDFCEHIKTSKGKKLHGKKVYEMNSDVKFIELSAVVDGACENCTIHNVFSGPELIEKVQEMCKVAAKKDEYKIEDKNKIKLAQYELNNIIKRTNAIKDAGIVITARGEDIDKLNKALELLKDVSKTILESKDVDYEFLADIGDLLSELQQLIITLVESGFASQNVNANENNVSDQEVMDAAAETGGSTPESTSPTPSVPGAVPPTGAAPAGTPSATPQSFEFPLSANSGNKMKKNSSVEGKLKESLIELENIVHKLKHFNDPKGKSMSNQKEAKRIQDANEISQKIANILTLEPLVFHQGDYTALIDTYGITAFHKNKKIASYGNEQLGKEIVASIKEDPKTVAENFITHIAKNSQGENNMEKNLNKEALQQNPPPVEEIQEGQLENLSGNFERKNDPTKTEGQVSMTTEGQLGNIPKSKETGKGSWERTRPENGKENFPVMEGQLDSGRPTDWGSERKESDRAYPEGQHSATQEWQLSQDSYGSERWDNDLRENYLQTTEAQFEGKDRTGTVMTEVPEGQLADRRQGTDKVQTHGKHAGKDYSDRVITAFVEGLANAVTSFKISPNTLVSVVPSHENIKTARTKLAGIGSELKKEDIKKIAEYAIARSIGVNQEIASPYIDEVVDVLYSDRTKLASSIKEVVEDRISQLKRVSSGQESKRTVESKIRSAWNKKTAAPIKSNKYILSTGDLNSKTPISKKNINEPAIMEILSSYLKGQFGNNLSVQSASVTEDGVITVHTQDRAENKENTQVSSPNNSNSMNDNSNRMNDHSNSNSESNMESEEQSAPLSMSAFARRELKKLAQNPAGTTMPPAGGMSGAPAPGGPPPGGVESLSAPSTGDFGAEESAPDETEMEDSGTQMEAQPFGAISPISGSDDVELVDGVYKDNTTGIEYTVDVNYRILNPQVLQNPEFLKKDNDESEPDAEMEGAGDESINDQLAAEPAGMTAPAIPGAKPAGGAGGGAGAGGGLMASAPSWVRTASLRYDMNLNPEIFNSDFIEKKSKSGIKIKTAVYKPGHICPQCGSKRVAFKANQGQCSHCGTKTYVHATKNDNGTLRVQMVVDNNLEFRKSEKNDWGGHAFNGPVENRKEIENALHQILSEKNSFIKVAKNMPDDPWFTCMGDQIRDGYDGENSVQICASIKDSFLKKIAMEDDENESEEESDKSENPPKKEKKMKKESDELDDALEMEKESDEDDDSVEFEGDTEDSDDSDESEESEFGETNLESEDDGLEEVIEDEGAEAPEESEFSEISDQDISNTEGEPTSANGLSMEKQIDVKNITHIDIYGTTPDGEEFEVEIPVNGSGSVDSPVADGDPDFFEIEEVVEGEPEDVIDILEYEDSEDGLEGDIEDEMGAGVEVDEDSEVDEDGEEMGLDDVFTMPSNPSDDDEEEGPEEEGEDEEDEFVQKQRNASLYLRKDRVASSNRLGGEFLTEESLEKIAQAIGLTMPTNTVGDQKNGPSVPKNKKEDGIREDGKSVHTSEKKNTAKDMKGSKSGNAAGSSLAKDPAVQGTDRGPRTIEPKKKASEQSWIKVSSCDEEAGEECEETKGEKKEVKKEVKKTAPKSSKKSTGDKRKGVHAKKDDDNDPDKDPKGPSGKKEVKKEKKEAQSSSYNPFVKGAQNNAPQQTEPIDAITEDKLEDTSVEPSLDIPRNEKKSKPQEFTEKRKDVLNPEEIRSSEYTVGPESTDLHNNSIIPRDKGGDGLGGKKPKFDKETAKDITSGNPDTYVQKIQEQNSVKPTPAGSEMNHAAKKDMKSIINKFASIKGFEVSDLEAIDFGNTIAIEQISTGKLFELKAKSSSKIQKKAISDYSMFDEDDDDGAQIGWEKDETDGYVIGDRVQVTGGPLIGFKGIIEELSPKGIKISFNLSKRDVLVSCPGELISGMEEIEKMKSNNVKELDSIETAPFVP